MNFIRASLSKLCRPLVPVWISACAPHGHEPAHDEMFNHHGHAHGCSWYCGAPEVRVKATSTFHDGYLSYSARNLHDANRETVWVEGVYGDGVGETITFQFDESGEGRDPGNEAGIGVSYVSIINGYARSKKLWKAYSRVKTLKYSFNGREMGRLELKDTMAPQEFDLPRMLFRGGKVNELTFEIVEIYPGADTVDTAMADFYFQGFGQMN